MLLRAHNLPAGQGAHDLLGLGSKCSPSLHWHCAFAASLTVAYGILSASAAPLAQRFYFLFERGEGVESD